MNKDFEYLNTFPDGHTERSAQNKFSSIGGNQTPISSVKVPIEDIEITIRKDREEHEARGFKFEKFFQTEEGEMYYPGMKSSVKLVKQLEAHAEIIRSQGNFTISTLIGNGGCTNYWTTRGLALYSYPLKNAPRIKNPKKIDVNIVKLIERTTPHGFKFKEYLPNIPYKQLTVRGDEVDRSLNFHDGEVQKLKKEMPGYYVVSKILYIRDPQGVCGYTDVGYAIYSAKKPNPLI
jgi:hypothetical protein